jgi:hypothetical protein
VNEWNREAQRRQMIALAITVVTVVVAYYLVDENPDSEGWLFTIALLVGLVGVGFLLVRRMR